jgi:uncharacterized heparinase superfamily protein
MRHGSRAWQTALQNLGWLQHFVASNRNLHAHYAMRLLGHWAKADKAKRDAATTAKILLSLAIDGHFLAQQCEPPLQTEFLDIVVKQTKRLARKSPRDPQSAIMKAVALLHVTTVFRGFETIRKMAHELLVANIDKLILSDGGHISRDPFELVKLLALLLPLKAAMKSDRQSLPNPVTNAIERMLPMLSMLSHGDGGLAAFHGNRPETTLLRAIQVQDEIRAKPLSLAPHSGYARVSQISSCLLADTQQRFEIEFSDGSQRLFRNGVIMKGHGGGAQLRRAAQGTVLQMSRGDHHHRTCFLSGDGTDLRVEDIHPPKTEIIFEIHPDVKLTPLREGGGFILVTPDRTMWQFSLRGAKLVIEQNGVVIKISNSDCPPINWALKKKAKPTKAPPRKQTPPPDLLV